MRKPRLTKIKKKCLVSYHQYNVLHGKQGHSQFHVGATYILNFATPVLQSLPIVATPNHYGFHYLHHEFHTIN